MADLSVLIPQESARLRDAWPLGASRDNGRAAAVQESPYHLADGPVVADLNPRPVLVAGESLKLADGGVAAQQGIVQILGVVHIQEGPALADLNPRPVAVNGESLKIGESLTAVLDEIASGFGESLTLADGPALADLNPRPVLVQAESLMIADTPSVTGDLQASGFDESLHVQDTLSASRDLTASGFDELGHLSDGPALADLNPRPVSVTGESLKVADTVTAAVTGDLAVVVGGESLHVVDAGGGMVQLIGVLHLTDGPVIASMSAAGALAASGFDELLHAGEAVGAIADATASVAELLHVGEAATPTLDPLLAVPATESLKIADPATAVFDLYATPAGELGHLGDGPASESLTPLQATGFDEALHVAESVAIARTPLETAAPLAESLKIADLMQAGDESVATGPESLTIGESLSVARDLSALGVGELLHLSDGPISDVGDLAVAVGGELLRLTDRVVILSVLLQETLHLSDGGAVAGQAQGLVQILGTLHLTDGPVLANLSNILGVAIGPESLKLADTPSAIRTPLEVVLTETLSLQYVSSEVEYSQDDYLRIAEALFVSLAAPTDLSVGITEQLHAADAVSANRTLEAAVTAEIVRLADTIAAARTVDAITTDSLAIAETLTASRDLTVSGSDERLHLVDGPIANQLDPIQQIAADVGRLDDSALLASLANPDDLSAGMGDETLHLADVPTPLLSLIVVLTERLVLGETLDSGFSQPLNVVLSDSLRMADVSSPAVTPVRAPVGSEDVTVGEELAAVLALVVVIDPESLRMSVQHPPQVGLDLATDTTNGPQTIDPDPAWDCRVPPDDWDVRVPVDDWDVVVR